MSIGPNLIVPVVLFLGACLVWLTRLSGQRVTPWHGLHGLRCYPYNKALVPGRLRLAGADAHQLTQVESTTCTIHQRNIGLPGAQSSLGAENVPSVER